MLSRSARRVAPNAHVQPRYPVNLTADRVNHVFVAAGLSKHAQRL